MFNRNRNKRALHLAHKIAYMTGAYPDKSIKEIAELFETSVLDFNVGAWLAQDLDLVIAFEDEGKIVLNRQPRKWQLGEDVEYLEKVIPYVFRKLAENEADLEENYFANWTIGFRGHDVLIAMSKLIEDGVMATYEIEDTVKNEENKDVKEKYTFYTLAENQDKQWGRKQFADRKKSLEKANKKKAK